MKCPICGEDEWCDRSCRNENDDIPVCPLCGNDMKKGFDNPFWYCQCDEVMDI